MLNESGTVVAFPAREIDRLRLAMRGLDAALEAQARAMAEYRGNLFALGGAVAALDASLQGYRAGLGEVGLEAQATAVAARRLDATADLLFRAAR